MINWLANPARFMRISGDGAAVARRRGRAACSRSASVWSLVVAPPDYQQGETVRIMYIHVPAAWMALSVYLFVAVASAVALVWRHPLAEIAAQAAAPIGAAFTLVCLVTGSLWGRPMWGDVVGLGRAADLGADAVLSLSRLYRAGERVRRSAAAAARAGSVLALVGVVNLPIIKFSVDWWNTLHQPASVMRHRRAEDRHLDAACRCWSWRSGFTLLFSGCCCCACAPRSTSARSTALRLMRRRRRDAEPARARPAGRRCAERGDDRAMRPISRWAAMPAFVWPAYGVAARRARRARAAFLAALPRPARRA